MKLLSLALLLSLTACGSDPKVEVVCPADQVCVNVAPKVDVPAPTTPEAPQTPVVEATPTPAPTVPEVTTTPAAKTEAPTAISPSELYLIDQEAALLEYVEYLKQLVGQSIPGPAYRNMFSTYTDPSGYSEADLFKNVFDGSLLNGKTYDYKIDIIPSSVETHQREFACDTKVEIVSHITDSASLQFKERLKISRYITITYDYDSAQFIVVSVVATWTTLDGKTESYQKELTCDEYPVNTPQK